MHSAGCFRIPGVLGVKSLDFLFYFTSFLEWKKRWQTNWGGLVWNFHSIVFGYNNFENELIISYVFYF